MKTLLIYEKSKIPQPYRLNKNELSMKCIMKNKMFLRSILSCLTLLLVILSPISLSAANDVEQQADITVSGVVSSENGETLIGVSVVVKGTTIGTVTGIDGDYKIKVPKTGATLVFSYLGYSTKEVKTKGETTLDVTLTEDSELLSEVVVVGYGVQKKINLTGSVSAVNSERVANRATGSLSTSLSGLSTGLSVSQGSGNPGSEDVKFTIRGTGSFNSSSPMVLIDGVQASMNDINPDDVESISVLKDGASAAIYGARAANGVILITSKRGGKNESPKITYSNVFASQKPVTSLKLMSDMPSWMEWHVIAQRNNDVNASPWYSDYQIATWRAANSNPYGVDNGYGIPNWMAYPNTDWSKEMFKSTFFQRHNLSVSGGAKNSNYLLSVGYQDNPGTLKNTGQERFNFRINAESTIADILKFGTQTYATKTKKQPGNASMPFLLQAYPGMIPEHNGIYGAGEDPSQYDRPNILRNVAAAGGKNENTAINTTWYVKGDIWNGISGEVKFNYQEISENSEGYTKNIPLYSHRLGMDKPVNEQNLESSSLTRKYAKTSSYLLDFLLHYNKQFGDHGIGALLGYEQTYWEKSGFRGEKLGMIDWTVTDIPESSEGKEKFYANPAKGDYAMLSCFGRVNYDYKGKYLFEANLRADASSRYAPGHRWGYFPSFSGGWRVTEEDFFAPFKENINDLKLRASWGKLGNTIGGSDYYAWQALYGQTNGVLGGEVSNGLAQSQPSNYNLTWESVSTFDIGFDMYLLNNRLNLSADYYQRNSSNILDKPAMSLTLGEMPNRQWLNTADMVNKGIEITLGWNDKIKDFKYGAVVNVSYNTNKVTKFKGNLDYAPISGQYDIWGRPVYGYTNLGDVSTLNGNTRRVEGHRIDEYYLNVPYKGSGTYYTADGKVDPKGGPTNGMIRTKADLEWVKSMIAAGYDFAGSKVGTPKNTNGTITGGSGAELWYGDQIMADLNGDGIYGDSNDQKFIGKSATPKWNLGTVLTAEWKGIDLSMTWEARLGSYAYLNDKGVNGNISLPYDAIPNDASSVYYTYDAHKSVYDYDNYDPATDPNANINGKYPRLLSARSKSPANTLYLQNTSFLKLRTLQIGYTLPKKWLSSAHLSNVRIFVSGENLLTIKSKNYKGVDPELGGSVIVYPLSRMFSGGVNVTF